MQETVNERSMKIVDVRFGGSKMKFVKAIELSQPTVYAMLAGKSAPSFKMIHAIVTKLNVSSKWLITGEGSMDDDEFMTSDFEKMKEEILDLKEENRQLYKLIVQRTLLSDEEWQKLKDSDFDMDDPSLYSDSE